MKKCLPITLLVSLLCFGAGCTPKQSSTSSTGGNTPTSSSVAPQVTVSSVEIEYDGETTVLAGSTAKLSAEAKMSDGSKGKVVWSSSNEEVAKVVNGSVSFKNVLEDATVTITATAKDDSSKSASITFEVKFTAFNFANSRGNFDNSLYLEDTSVIVEKGDSAIMFNEVHGTKWYVEADVTPSTDLGTETDQYPKFGIMTGNSDMGNWSGDDKALFYFVDAQNPATTSNWTAVGFVSGTKDNTNYWAWPGTSASVSADNKFSKEETTKMGLMRDGVHYYLYAGRGDGYGIVKHFVNEHFAADEATYAWFGGWQSAYTISNASYLIGDAIDSKYEEVTNITLSSYEQTLYINDTYQLDYKVNTDMYNPSKLTFTSSNPEVATVSQTGLVTAGATAGTATITVAYEDIKVDFAVEVTTDAMFKVELNGQMDDKLWSQSVKDRKIAVKAGEQLVDVYVARNSKGVYIYGDYSTNAIRNNGGEWWQQDNIEFRLVTKNDPKPLDPDQIWVSSVNGGSHNAHSGYVTPLELNEETNRYEMTFEIFVPYNDPRFTASPLDPVGLHWGTAAIAGWVCCSWWYNDVFENSYIVSYYDPSVCEEHVYGDYFVAVESSCANDGEEHRVCYVCGHVDVKVNPKGDHNYSEVLSVTPSTCCTHGTKEVKCPGCQDVKTIELPLDPGVHPYGATYSDGKWSCCETEIPSQTAHWEAWGWGDVHSWSYIAKGLKGDFVVKTTYTHESNDANAGLARCILPIVQHDLGSEAFANNQHGSCWVTRMDWWGWCDQWQSSEKLTNDFNNMDAGKDVNRDMDWTDANGNNCADKYVETVTNCTIEWTCTRTGTTVLNSFVITAANGSVYTYWTKATDINEEKLLNLALASEYAKATVTSVSISQPSEN